MKELLDIINIHNEIVGRAERTSVHKKGLLHRLIIVMVFNPDGKLFVQQRSFSKDVYPGCFEGSLSGHIASGESFRKGALREFHEELGVCIPPKRLKELLKFRLQDENERVFTALYAVKDFAGELKVDEEESVQGSYWSVKKLESELRKGVFSFHPVFREAWNLFRQSGEKSSDFVKL